MEFAVIFTQMGWLPAILLIVGLVMLLIEIFIAGFGFFGITGSISLVAGVIVRICNGLNFAQSLTLILLIIGVFCLAILLMVISAKYGLLSRSGLFETKSTLPVDYNKAEKSIRKLVGKSGKAVTDLSLSGKAKIKGEIYNVSSINSFIEEGSNIKVVEVVGEDIKVRKWFE